MKIGVVDFFCGCGGASTGFQNADVEDAEVEVIGGIDNDPHCCSTFENMVGAPATQENIADLVDKPDKLQDLLSNWGADDYDRLILVGCAPCQGFAAHRKSVEGEDKRRNLFVIFSEVCSIVEPDGVFMENVPDIFSEKHWEYYALGRRTLSEAGYDVHGTVYNFAEFGLPQERFRAIMMAFPNSFKMPEPKISPSSYRTVRDAIGDLPPLGAGEQLDEDPMHRASNHRKSTVETLKQIPLDGGNRPPGVGPDCLDRAREEHGGYTDVYGRLAWDEPAVTITSRCRTPSCGRFVHPEQHRGLSPREAALLQGFPPDYQFEGPFDDKFKQIGNAVPPLVASKLAKHMVDTLRAEEDNTQKPGINLDVRNPVGPGFAVTINGIKQRRNKSSQPSLFQVEA